MYFDTSYGRGFFEPELTPEFLRKFNEINNTLMRPHLALNSRHFNSSMSSMCSSGGAPLNIKWAWCKLYDALPNKDSKLTLISKSANGEGMSAETPASCLADAYSLHTTTGTEVWPEEHFILRFIRVQRQINNFFTALDANEEHLNRLKDVELALIKNQHHKLRIYRDAYSVTIITNQVDVQETLWKVFGLLPVLFPAIKETVDAPENQDLFNIFKAFYGCDASDLLPYIEKDYDHIKGILKQHTIDQFKNILLSSGNQQMDQLRRNINSLRNDMNNAYRAASDYEQRLSESLHTLTGLEITGVNLDLTVLDFLKNTNAIEIDHTEGALVRFKVITPITNFEPNDMRAYYRSLNTVTEVPWLAQLLKDTFVEEKLQVITTTLVTMNIIANRDSTVTPDNETRTGNPHLTGYQCFSAAQSTMRRFLSEGRILDMLNQLIATCASFNVVDSPVMNYFLNRLKHGGDAHNQAIFRDVETGEMFSPAQYKEKYETPTVDTAATVEDTDLFTV